MPYRVSRPCKVAALLLTLSAATYAVLPRASAKPEYRVHGSLDSASAAADFRVYNQRAATLAKQARLTGLGSMHEEALRAAERSLALAPGNLDGLRLLGLGYLTFHRFADALDLAQEGLERHPKQADLYPILVDALVELGRYPEAIDAAQRMVAVLPSAPAYARVSYLRALHGDRDGAIAAMRLALQAADPGDQEGLAWYHCHLAEELIYAARVDEAETQVDAALALLPRSPLALAGKARIALARGELEAAAPWLERAQEQLPLPDVAILLGEIQERLGRDEEARRQYELAERIEALAGAGATYSRRLAILWADQGRRLDEALAAAHREAAHRSDIHASDTLAWVLFKRGEVAEARRYIEAALRLGTRDPRIAYHAGMVYKAAAEPKLAMEYLQAALRMNPNFSPVQAEIARRALAELKEMA